MADKKPTPDQLRQLVESALARVRAGGGGGDPMLSNQGSAAIPEVPVSRGLVNERDVLAARERGLLRYAPGTIITPLARDTASRYQVVLEEAADREGATGVGRVAIGSDHGGFKLKEHLKGWLKGQGYRVEDLGCHSTESVDYPDLAVAVASRVARGQADRGVIIDGAGIGSCMTANKVPGILAALAYDTKSARIGRSHDDANVLCLGASALSPDQAAAVTEIFLTTAFEGGRHARRVGKIRAIERGFLRS